MHILIKGKQFKNTDTYLIQSYYVTEDNQLKAQGPQARFELEEINDIAKAIGMITGLNVVIEIDMGE